MQDIDATYFHFRGFKSASRSGFQQYGHKGSGFPGSFDGGSGKFSRSPSIKVLLFLDDETTDPWSPRLIRTNAEALGLNLEAFVADFGAVFFVIID